MTFFEIIPWEDGHLSAVLSLRQKVFDDRHYDFQMDNAIFRERVLGSASFSAEGALVAKAGEAVVGFALVAKSTETDAGFLSVVMVDPARRGKGIGSNLVSRVESFLKSEGIHELRVGYKGNPISFCVGADVRTPGYTFLLNRGFRNRGSLSLWMEADLGEFQLPDEILGYIAEGRKNGLEFGLCEESHWEGLCQFMQVQFPGGWEQSITSRLEGSPPYTVVVAAEGTRVVGFAGPIRVHENGAAGFTGIGTDPEYRRRKIGSILFNLMCEEFQKRGATHNVLHTGVNNPAQEIYFGAGYRVMTLVDYSLVKQL